jgi:5-formyltetrahydrofolate cyclo-ligase
VAADLPNEVRRPLVQDKQVLRGMIRRNRRVRDGDGPAVAAALADRVDALPEVRTASTVATYLSAGAEPPTTALLPRWRARGVTVLLPVVLPDLDLDWAVYDGPQQLGRARRGLLEPVGPRLGLDAIATADVVLTPGLAVDRSGMRLGQGGGCYDRALGRVPVGTFVCTLLYDGELVDELPAAPHDRPVNAVVTPSSLTRLTQGRG